MQGEPLRPEQCRAARALLRWTIPRLAEASGVAARTINRFELQMTSRPMPANLAEIRRALEAAGVVFIATGDGLGPGVRLRDP